MTEDAGRGWDNWLEQHGVTFSAVVEAAGRLLAQRPKVQPFVEPTDIVELARAIDRERTKRR